MELHLIKRVIFYLLKELAGSIHTQGEEITQRHEHQKVMIMEATLNSVCSIPKLTHVPNRTQSDG